MGPRQAGVLRLNTRQVSLPNRQASKVPTAQVAPLQAQEVHHVARPITLLCVRPMAPFLKKHEQPLLRSAAPSLRLHSLEDWQTDKTLLSLPHVVLSLRLDQRLLHQQSRFAPLYLAGYVAYYAKHDRQAIADLEQADQQDPFILLLLAQTHQRLGERTRAREYYTKVMASTSHAINNAFARPIARRQLSLP